MRYEIIADTAITVDMNNGYSILAMSRWNKERVYMILLYLLRIIVLMGLI